MAQGEKIAGRTWCAWAHFLDKATQPSGKLSLFSAYTERWRHGGLPISFNNVELWWWNFPQSHQLLGRDDKKKGGYEQQFFRILRKVL